MLYIKSTMHYSSGSIRLCGPRPVPWLGPVVSPSLRRPSSGPVFGAGKVRRELVSKLGLAGEINRRLKRHLPYHESDHVLNIAYNLLCGGTAQQRGALGAKVIPSPTAAGDFTRRFGEGGVIELQIDPVMDGCPS